MRLSILLGLLYSVLSVQFRDFGEDGIISALEIRPYRSSSSNQFELMRETELGRVFMDFAEIEMQVTGAVDSLAEVIKGFGRQLEDKINKENEYFDAIQGDHVSKGLMLESLVNQAELEITREKKKLSQELIPRTGELDDIIQSLNSKKQNNAETEATAKSIRRDQNIAFTQSTNEISEAIKAVDDALVALKQLGVEDSFVEITSEQSQQIAKRVKNIKQRAEKVGKFFGSFLSALSQLSDFADRLILKQLSDLLNGLRAGLVESLQKAYADEEQQKNLHEQRILQLADELKVFEKQQLEAIQEREEKSLQIKDTEQLISNREKDHDDVVKRLQIENNTFSMNQKIHDDLISSINLQIGDIEKNLETLNDQSMMDYLQTAMNKARY